MEFQFLRESQLISLKLHTQVLIATSGPAHSTKHEPLSMANITIILLLFFISPFLTFHTSNSQQTWIRAGYWDSSAELPISWIESALFTHLLCAFSYINSSSYEMYIKPSKVQQFYTFSSTVRIKNPSVVSLLSIWAGGENLSAFSSMIDEPSLRKAFIESSVRTARSSGFDGLDLSGVEPSMSTSMNMTNLGTLFQEWREAVASESKASGKQEMLLVMTGRYMPVQDSMSYPVDSISRNLDWLHFMAFDYYVPTKDNFTGFHAALYGASNWSNTDNGIKEWLRRGLSTGKLVLGLPYHGYAWILLNPSQNANIGAPASGPAITLDGSAGYKHVKSLIQDYGYGAAAVYNSTYVVNCYTRGSVWINFDDVEAIKAKISYAKKNNLRGYTVFQLSNDDNWVLSRAAMGVDEEKQKKRPLGAILITSIAVFLLLCFLMICFWQKKVLKSRGIGGIAKRPWSAVKNTVSAAENFDDAASRVFRFNTIEKATNDFSSANKLGEGGFGPVYKGKLPGGKEIAVKRLSETSDQGAEEFKNEVTLTARLQHVNLARVLGFCTDGKEKLLIYEYMPNKSLDFYLYDPSRRHILDWRKRVNVIEGIIQGLLYLQEYSNFTIIHRDLKASNILLDEHMNPKISDFGMARLFRKDELQANTGRIVGTFGYVPPEYVRSGTYSMKFDVYSFGVLLLQIISGKKNSCCYGPDENLNLLEYAYNLWKDNQGLEFTDPSLDDSSSSCKLPRCLQVGLLCVQENPLDRPSMLEVSLILKDETAAIVSPKRPAFSLKTDEDEGCALRIQSFSVNDATISQLLPR